MSKGGQCELCYVRDGLAKFEVNCVSNSEGFIRLCSHHTRSYGGHKEKIRCECFRDRYAYVTIYDPRSCVNNGGVAVLPEDGILCPPSEWRYFAAPPTVEQQQDLDKNRCQTCNGSVTIPGINIWYSCVDCGDRTCSNCVSSHGHFTDLEEYVCFDCDE